MWQHGRDHACDPHARWEAAGRLLLLCRVNSASGGGRGTRDGGGEVEVMREVDMQGGLGYEGIHSSKAAG